MLIQRTAEKELQSLARDYKVMKPYIDIADDNCIGSDPDIVAYVRRTLPLASELRADNNSG